MNISDVKIADFSHISQANGLSFANYSRPIPASFPSWSFDDRLWQCVDHLVDWPTQRLSQVHDYLDRAIKSWRHFTHYREALGFKSEDGQVFQVRYIANETDNTQRYDAPTRAGIRIYRPPVPDEFRLMIGARYNVCFAKGSFWNQVQNDKSVAILDCEGPAKALTMVGLGYAAISSYGAFAGVEANEWKSESYRNRENKQKVRHYKERTKVHLPLVTKALAKGREWILVPDQDISPKTKSQVLAAFRFRGRLLEAEGARVKVALWDASLGKGIDDVYANHGAEVIEQIIANALPLQDWIASHVVKPRLGKANAYEHTRNLDKTSVEIPDTGIVYTNSGMGTGKTKLLAELTNGKTMVAPYPLRTLAKNAADRLNALYKNETVWRKDGLHYSDRGELGDRLTLCYDSFGRLDLSRQFAGEPPEDLVLDEVSHGLRHMILGATCKKDRLAILRNFVTAVQSAKRILCFDADLTQVELEIISRIRGRNDGEFYLQNTYQGNPWNVEVLQASSLSPAIETLADKIHGEKLWHWATDGKETSKAIKAYLEGLGIPCLLINSETTAQNDPLINAAIAGDFSTVGKMFQVVVTSPSVIQGLSWEDDIFEGVIGTFTGCSISPRQMVQAIGRVRHPVPRYLWVAEKRRYSGKLPSQSPAQIRTELVQLLGYTGQRLNVSIDVDNVVELAVSSYVDLVVADNKLREYPRAIVCALLSSRGHQVHRNTIAASSGKDYRIASKAVKHQTVADILSADCLTASEFKALDEAEYLTKEEQFAVLKYKAAHTWSLTPDLITQAHVEAYLTGGGTTMNRGFTFTDEGKTHSETLGKRSAMPWDRSSLFAEGDLLKALGLPEMIDWLKDKHEVDTNTPELAAFKQRCLKFAIPIKQLLNHSVREIDSPVKVLADMLGMVALKLSCRRTSSKRFYHLDLDTGMNYEVQECIKRKQEAYRANPTESPDVEQFSADKWNSTRQRLLPVPNQRFQRVGGKRDKESAQAKIPLTVSARGKRTDKAAPYIPNDPAVPKTLGSNPPKPFPHRRTGGVGFG